MYWTLILCFCVLEVGFRFIPGLSNYQLGMPRHTIWRRLGPSRKQLDPLPPIGSRIGIYEGNYGVGDKLAGTFNLTQSIGHSLFWARLRPDEDFTVYRIKCDGADKYLTWTGEYKIVRNFSCESESWPLEAITMIEADSTSSRQQKWRLVKHGDSDSGKILPLAADSRKFQERIYYNGISHHDGSMINIPAKCTKSCLHCSKDDKESLLMASTCDHSQWILETYHG